MAEVFCTRCGHGNRGDANFCSSCGSPLEGVVVEDRTQSLTPIDPDSGSVPEVALAMDDLPADAGVLLVRRGPGAGSRFVLDREVVLAGRHPDSDIFLDDVTVSRRHAEFRKTPEGYVLRDVGSLNGTYLNRERIDEAVVGNGDEVQIGRFKLVFLLPGAADTDL